jgi:hypothetical protein
MMWPQRRATRRSPARYTRRDGWFADNAVAAAKPVLGNRLDIANHHQECTVSQASGVAVPGMTEVGAVLYRQRLIASRRLIAAPTNRAMCASQHPDARFTKACGVTTKTRDDKIGANLLPPRWIQTVPGTACGCGSCSISSSGRDVRDHHRNQCVAT